MKPYKVAEVIGSNGRQWVVGRNDSDTTLFYFTTKAEALKKLAELKDLGIEVA